MVPDSPVPREADGGTPPYFPLHARAHAYTRIAGNLETCHHPPPPSPPKTPRPYQTRAIEDLRAAMRHHRRVLLVLPTGGGKTFIATAVARGAVAKGRRVVFLVHREELLDQTSRSFTEAGIVHGLIRAGEPTPDASVAVAMVQTLTRRLAQVPAPDLLFVDEAHHAAAGTWGRIAAAWPDAWQIGLTATPCRQDGRGLGDAFDALVNGPTVAGLIAQGYLSRYRAFAPATVDLTGVRTRGGDFDSAELEQRLARPSITGDLVAHYRRLAAGKRAIIFAATLCHSQAVVTAFQGAGVAAAHLDGETPRDQRRAVLEAFAAGEVRVLSNVALFGEGFDLPSIEAVILARPTQSLALHLQQIGRGLRPAPGKDHALILDHAGNLMRHGLPDEPREWSLDGLAGPERKGAAVDAPAIPQCPECFCVYSGGLGACPECGRENDLTAAGRPPVEQAGELAEIAPESFQRPRQFDCRTLEELRAFAKLRGYKPGWADYVWRGRQARRECRA